MIDTIWALRLKDYTDDELRKVYRGTVPGEESDAALAAMAELATRAKARKG